MGEERDGRNVAVDGRRKRRGDVAVAVDRRVGQSELLELVAQEAEQDELALGARGRLRILIGLRVDLRVPDQPRSRVFRELRRERRSPLNRHRCEPTDA